MMSRKRFYYLSLLLPLIFPFLAAWIFHLLIKDPWDSCTEPMCYYSTVAFGIGFFGTVPYLVFAIGTAIWMRKKTSCQVERAMWICPLFSLPCVVLFFLFMMLGAKGGQIWNLVTSGFETAILILVYCYGLVLFTRAAAWFLTRLRLLEKQG